MGRGGRSECAHCGGRRDGVGLIGMMSVLNRFEFFYLSSKGGVFVCLFVCGVYGGRAGWRVTRAEYKHVFTSSIISERNCSLARASSCLAVRSSPEQLRFYRFVAHPCERAFSYSCIGHWDTGRDALEFCTSQPELVADHVRTKSLGYRSSFRDA